MYHLSVKPISRSNGRTATAAAAYRAGAEIADLRTGEFHDYTRKRDIVHSELVLPAGSPAWAQDRAALWNAAEAAEKRKDARVARDYEVAIPKELTRDQGIDIALRWPGTPAPGLSAAPAADIEWGLRRHRPIWPPMAFRSSRKTWPATPA